jgi:hypothetical protein
MAPMLMMLMLMMLMLMMLLLLMLLTTAECRMPLWRGEIAR